MDDRYDLVKGWVFVPSCAHMQRLIDNLEYLKKPAFNHIIDVPRKVNEVTTSGWPRSSACSRTSSPPISAWT